MPFGRPFRRRSLQQEKRTPQPEPGFLVRGNTRETASSAEYVSLILEDQTRELPCSTVEHSTYPLFIPHLYTDECGHVLCKTSAGSETIAIASLIAALVTHVGISANPIRTIIR